ncbi:MAG: hypothetical protein G9473_08790 [Erythrobacter sp.]|nr:MAG: hypothetical protein G9473_08790 [Erythrobacter sp.]
MKTWAGLGLAGALIGSGLAGCAEDTPGDDADLTEAVEPGEGGEAGEGEGGEAGEGGESGEGGVDVAAAAKDPVAYRTALAVAQAHAMAAHEAFLAGKTDPAAEMFGHPVSEVLADMGPVFSELGVADFTARFNEASQAVLDGRSAVEVDERYGAILAALDQAAAKAPGSDMAEADIAARVIADMIARAAAMYREAEGSERYEPYLDGYGYTLAGAGAFEDAEPAILAVKPDLAARIRAALDLLARAYPGAERPARLDAEPGELLAASSRVALAL